MPVIAVIPCDLEASRFGLPSRLADMLAGRSVLAHTVMRVASVPQVTRVVLVHPAGQEPMALLGGMDVGKPVSTFADPDGLRDAATPGILASRKWAMTSWRGGLGQATAYDEALPAGPVAKAAAEHGAESVLLVRGDWCFVDPDFAADQVKAHLTAPASMRLVFTQAPPGLSGLVAYRQTLEEMADAAGTFGRILGYNPHKPMIDPIGRDVNVPVPAEVRDCYHRFVYDTPRSIAHMRRIAGELGEDIVDADAATIADVSRQVDATRDPGDRLPPIVTVELTPRRAATGPATPQHHLTFDRPDLDVDLATRLFAQLEPDTVVILGGLGDALEHPDWEAVVSAARDANLLGIGLSTDLLAPPDTVKRLLDVGLDLVTVRVNADTAETYHTVMGADRFGAVARNLEVLFNTRNGAGRQLPWIVPSLVKLHANLKDMESFFERWMRVAGHAVIEPMQTGCGLVPDASPVPMAPPRRGCCRQLAGRMTILSDGTVALCDQDWQGRGALGDAKTEPLADIWRRIHEPVLAHREGTAMSLPLCGNCTEWHRP